MALISVGCSARLACEAFLSADGSHELLHSRVLRRIEEKLHTRQQPRLLMPMVDACQIQGCRAAIQIVDSQAVREESCEETDGGRKGLHDAQPSCKSLETLQCPLICQQRGRPQLVRQDVCHGRRIPDQEMLMTDSHIDALLLQLLSRSGRLTGGAHHQAGQSGIGEAQAAKAEVARALHAVALHPLPCPTGLAWSQAQLRCFSSSCARDVKPRLGTCSCSMLKAADCCSERRPYPAAARYGDLALHLFHSAFASMSVQSAWPRKSHVLET